MSRSPRCSSAYCSGAHLARLLVSVVIDADTARRCPAGAHSAPPFLKFPTCAFFVASTLITGLPSSWNAVTWAFRFPELGVTAGVLHPLDGLGDALQAGPGPGQPAGHGPRRHSRDPARSARRPDASGSAQHIADPGAPGCLPRLRFFASSRSPARRCLRGGLRPGTSSPEGGHRGVCRCCATRIRSSRATCSRSCLDLALPLPAVPPAAHRAPPHTPASASSAACATSPAICASSRAAQLAQPGAEAASRTRDAIVHVAGPHSRQADTLSRL